MAATDFPQLRRPLKFACDSDQGRQRDNNEDLIGIDPECGVFVVIDGVGGHAAGEVAAQIAREQLLARLADPTDTIERRMREAIAVANKEIFERAQEDEGLRGMACVLTAAVIEGERMTIGHVGDTRLYKIRHGKIRKITHDHSPVGEMEDRHEISEWDAMQHSRRNEIYRDVGSEFRHPDEEGFIEIIHESFEADSSVLICSDGLTDMITSDEILRVTHNRAGDPDAVVRDLIRAANDAGGKDNISVVYIEGDRFASSLRQPFIAQTTPTPVVFQEGAGLRRRDYVEPEIAIADRSSSLAALWSRWAIFLYGAIVGMLLFYIMQQYFAISPPADAGNRTERQTTLRVDATDRSAYTTIGEAMEKARAGDTIEVAPGRYRERVILKDGVALISRKSREAVILSPGDEPRTAVLIEGVKSGRLSGFSIEGNEGGVFSVGIRIANSDVEVTDTEVFGAMQAGVEIEGGSVTVRACYLHDNPGAGVVIRGEGASLLAHNVIARNGRQTRKKRAGIEISDSKARLENVFNVLEDNGIKGILKSRGDEVEDRRNR
ncbi:MAG: protein phosphatase 2C domain-containing protein [Acidobacteriota bacterium]